MRCNFDVVVALCTSIVANFEHACACHRDVTDGVREMCMPHAGDCLVLSCRPEISDGICHEESLPDTTEEQVTTDVSSEPMVSALLNYMSSARVRSCSVDGIAEESLGLDSTGALTEEVISLDGLPDTGVVATGSVMAMP